MPRSGAEHLRESLLVRVERPCDERRLGADRDGERVERMVERPHRRRLRHLSELRGRRVLPLRQAVDPVVEEEDLQVHVAAERVDEVVAADRERVAVAGHDPDRQIGPRDREPGRDRRCATVDRMHPVRLHVVGEARRAADSRDEHDPLAGESELRHESLDDVQDRVVAAARAPADLLVGLEVLRGQLHEVSVAVAHCSSAESRSGRSRGRRRSSTWKRGSSVGCSCVHQRHHRVREFGRRTAARAPCCSPPRRRGTRRGSASAAAPG